MPVPVLLVLIKSTIEPAQIKFTWVNATVGVSLMGINLTMLSDVPQNGSNTNNFTCLVPANAYVIGGEFSKLDVSTFAPAPKLHLYSTPTAEVPEL